jgi:hypothetical protein
MGCQSSQDVSSYLKVSSSTASSSPRGRRISLQVIPQKVCRHVSLHNNHFLADKIQMTSNWYNNGPRHDFVVVNLESLSFAQVHALLILTHNDEQYQIALIRLLKTTKQPENIGAGSGLTTPKRNRITGYIHAGKSSDYRFVSTKCFIHSAFVHPLTGHCSQYIINDLIDQDMYFRLAQARRTHRSNHRHSVGFYSLLYFLPSCITCFLLDI